MLAMQKTTSQVILCTIGTILEWYDFSLFAALSPYLSAVFFPHTDRITAVMSVFVVFASGFIMRPIGAVFFGYFGDRKGRKSTILLTIILMMVATAGIGFIPAGTTLASIVLVILRLLQGFGASGEQAGGSTLLTEQGSSKHKTFITSFGIFASITGLFSGTLICVITSKILGHDAMLAWGWRLPFMLSIPFGLAGYWVRKSLLESQEFIKEKLTNNLSHFPLAELLRKYKKNLIIIMSFFILTNICFYINYMYFESYALQHHKINETQAMYLSSAATLMYAASVVFFAHIADRVGRIWMLGIGSFLLATLTYPLFMCIINGDFVAQLSGQLCFAGIIGIFSGSVIATAGEYFPIHVRYTGIGVAVNIAASVFGGTAPLVCAYLIKATANPISPALYIMICAVIVCVIVLTSVRRVGKA